MHVIAIRTPIVEPNTDLFAILDEAFPTLEERSVVVISSKIVALAEGRVVSLDSVDKHELIEREAQFYIHEASSKYGVTMAMVHNMLFASAGIDESNADGYYVLWPENLQESVNRIWEYLRKKHGLKELGVILADSRTTPMIWGVIGAGIAHCGFQALNSMIGRPDIFGRPMKMTKVSVVQGVAAAAVLEMGETDEQTPLAVVTGVREIHFQDRVPTQEELDDLKLTLEDDLYAPILTKADWKRGGAEY
jgi:putative folate metabolism gamma-glutamate ligase